MTNSSVQIIGLIISLISALCTVLSVILPEWKRNDVSDEIIEAVIRHQGLWIRCVAYTTGLWQCDDYDSFFVGLPLELQISRGLAVASIAGVIFGILLSIIGMDCTTCMGDSKRTKSRVAQAASGFWIFQSLSIGIAVSLFAHDIVRDFGVSEQLEIALGQNLSLKYIFGSSLFLGWAAMAVGLVGGAVMLCGSCYTESDDEEYWNRGKLGKGIQRVRNSFRDSYRVVRPRRSAPGSDYV